MVQIHPPLPFYFYRDIVDRRNLLKLGAAALVSLAIPKLSFASATKPRGISIDNIIGVSFDAVKHHLCNGHQFASDALKIAQDRGDILVTGLGVCVEHKGKTYKIQELGVPIVWTTADEARNSKESEKIALAASLVSNAFLTHDDLLLEKLEGHRLVVSKAYTYWLGPSCGIGNTGTYRKMFTAFAQIPKE